MSYKILLKPALIYIAFFAFWIISCSPSSVEVQLDGTAKNMDGYVISISKNDSVIAGENVARDRFKMALQLPEEDFYTLEISQTDSEKPALSFPVFLSGGSHRISLDLATIERYPEVNGTSQVQEELTIFNRMLEKAPDSLNAARKDFITNHPDSPVSAFLLSGIYEQKIEYEPELHLAQYLMLGPQAKQSKYARQYKKAIEKYMNGRVNSTLPDISGVQVSGKPFDKNSLKGKLTLVMFWRSLNKDSRNDNVSLLNTYQAHHLSGFEIVAISFDSSKERWEKYLKDNQLPWTNIYDPEGINSDNIRNFGNTTIPYYFLVGPDLKIIERNPPIESLPIYIKEFVQGKK